MPVASDFVHSILVDEVPTPEGWRVWCVPHGPLGVYRDRAQAVLIGLEHDYRHGGRSWL